MAMSTCGRWWQNLWPGSIMLELSDDLLIHILDYLEPVWISQLLNNINNKRLYERLTRLMQQIEQNHPSLQAQSFPGPSFVKHGRITIRPIMYQKVLEIQKSKKLKVEENDGGFRLGQLVMIRKDNQNSYWQGHYKPSDLVKKYGYIVGCSRCYVRIAIGNMWSRDVRVIQKRNECVCH